MALTPEQQQINDAVRTSRLRQAARAACTRTRNLVMGSVLGEFRDQADDLRNRPH
jgi:hypothetical protein